MSKAQPPYSGWHPRRLPERPGTPDGGRNLYDRPPTPLFGLDSPTREGPSGPRLGRQGSQASLLPLYLEPPLEPRPARMQWRERISDYSQRVPLPQGVSLTVAVCTTFAFALSITTLAVGMKNRRMLLDATEQRHDPHSALMHMIYNTVVEALRANATGQLQVAPPPP